MLRWVFLLASVAALGACSSNANKLQGNETGGIIPDTVKSASDAAEAARAHCAQYNRVSRITATQAEAGGTTVFVCEQAAPAPPPPQPGPPRKK